MDGFDNKLNDLLKAQIPTEEKLSGVLTLLDHEHIEQLAAEEDLKSTGGTPNERKLHRHNLFLKTAGFLMSIEDVPDSQIECFCDVGGFVCAVLQHSDGWVFFKKVKIDFLLQQNRDREASPLILELSELLPGDMQVLEWIDKQDQKAPLRAASRVCKNGCDEEFYHFINKIETETTEKLLLETSVYAHTLQTMGGHYKDYYDALLNCCSRWQGIKALSPDNKRFAEYFGSRYSYLKQNIDELVMLYHKLEDYRSKYTLKTLLKNWLTLTPDLRSKGIESTFEPYFDLDIMQCADDEVFVDCGAFDGETVCEFIRQYGDRYKSIYAYEPTNEHFPKVQKRLWGMERIFLRNAGVSDKSETIRAGEGLGVANCISDHGNATANVVRLDDDIKEDITFLKMNIEGAELAALMGAQEHIMRAKPKLAISLYHKPEDLLEIPRYIHSIVPEYRFYLRHFPNGMMLPVDYMLLAVAPNREQMR